MDKEYLQQFIGRKEDTIEAALEKININAIGTLFIEDENEKLVGVLSDGDIRRWLINSGSLKASVFEAMNDKPISLPLDKKALAAGVMAANYIMAVPVVDDSLHIVDVIDSKGITLMHRKSENILKDVPVVMMAGGKGTRLYPYTRILPKPLIPVGDKPISQLIFDGFYEYGCKDFYMIVNHKKNMIKSYFNETDSAFRPIFIDEEKPLGTGGGISLLKGKITGTFILTNCDNYITEDYSEIVKYHKENNHVITMICAGKKITVPYGVVELSESGTINSIEEKPELSFLVNTGIYIVEPSVIDMIEESTYADFPDILEGLRKEGRSIGVYSVNEKSFLDMGQLDELEKMKEYFE